MRKITLNPSIGSVDRFSKVGDFDYDWIVVKDGGTVQEFRGHKKIANSYSYTAEQLVAITDANHVLSQNDQPEMTPEEIEYLLFPFGREKKTGPEEIQALAGFRVEKTLRSLP